MPFLFWCSFVPVHILHILQWWCDDCLLLPPPPCLYWWLEGTLFLYDDWQLDTTYLYPYTCPTFWSDWWRLTWSLDQCHTIVLLVYSFSWCLFLCGLALQIMCNCFFLPRVHKQEPVAETPPACHQPDARFPGTAAWLLYGSCDWFSLDIPCFCMVMGGD